MSAHRQATPDSIRFLAQLPVVRPGRLRDCDRKVRLEMLAGTTHRVLLRVTPAIPCALDRGIDKLEPFLVAPVVGRGRQREQLPTPVLAYHRHDRLTARPAHVAIWPRVVRIGRHQSLLDGEDEVVRGMQCGRRHGWIVPPQPDLQGADRLAQRLRSLGVVAEKEGLDVVKETVGLRQ